MFLFFEIGYDRVWYLWKLATQNSHVIFPPSCSFHCASRKFLQAAVHRPRKKPLGKNMPRIYFPQSPPGSFGTEVLDFKSVQDEWREELAKGQFEFIYLCFQKKNVRFAGSIVSPQLLNPMHPRKSSASELNQKSCKEGYERKMMLPQTGVSFSIQEVRGVHQDLTFNDILVLFPHDRDFMVPYTSLTPVYFRSHEIAMTIPMTSATKAWRGTL